MKSLSEYLGRMESAGDEAATQQEGVRIFQEIWSETIETLGKRARAAAREHELFGVLNDANGKWKKIVSRYPKLLKEGSFAEMVRLKLPEIFQDWVRYARRSGHRVV